MNDFELKVADVLLMLARLVSRAGRSQPTSAEACLICPVPTALLEQARQVLMDWQDTEFATREIRLACLRDIQPATPKRKVAVPVSEPAALMFCHAQRDGDCIHPDCPQNRDGEPEKTGRSCPLPQLDDDD